MIQSFINTVTPLTSNNSSVVFQKDCIRTNSCNGCGGWLYHSEGSANYDITSGGIYKLNFNATVSSATAGAIAFALFRNGEQIPGTLMTSTIATAGDYVNLGINKEIRVCCKENANISVRAVATVPTATAPTTPISTQIPIIGNANLTIDRRC